VNVIWDFWRRTDLSIMDPCHQGTGLEAGGGPPVEKQSETVSKTLHLSPSIFPKAHYRAHQRDYSGFRR